MRAIEDVGRDLGFGTDDLQPWGPQVAKVRAEVAFRPDPPRARLVLVSAISPTPAGEGKTTCTVGLTQAARKLGANAMAALREPRRAAAPAAGSRGSSLRPASTCTSPATSTP
jgi:formate--tetrahydrofolate ligase